jgi:O-6-methylguanine DNA methyltransferase
MSKYQTLSGPARAERSASTSDFSTKVYAFVRQIPQGYVSTYGDVALKIGHPGAARAVGTVLAKNPYSVFSTNDPQLVVNCHRVVSSTGHIAGFFGRTDPIALGWKQYILQCEGVVVDNNRIVNFDQRRC